MSDIPYNLDDLMTQHQMGNSLKYIYFWGHQPRTKGQIDHSCFSQWYPSPFVVDDVNYATAEHYMMAQKALLFNDGAIFDKIIASSHPSQAKKLGQQVANFDEKLWYKHRFDIVVNGNLAKFLAHETLKSYLLSTKSHILVEASPVDKIWGVGLAKDDGHITNPLKWRGQNLLGFALMQVRDKLI